MTKEKTNKSGAGKFFLGAVLGALAGAVAGKFISNNEEEAEECDCSEDCKCGKDCKCDEKKPAEKTKTTDKPEKKITKKEA